MGLGCEREKKIYNQMTSNFLQRFKGKTQQISKEGVANILGSNSGHNPNQERHFNSVKATSKNESKSKIPSNTGMGAPRVSSSAANNKVPSQDRESAPNSHATRQKPENPFLVSNPFYLDEEEREREELQKREQKRIEEQTRKAQLAQLKQQKDPKDVTKTSSYSRSHEKKKGGGKQWVKLGGLGANIGGDEWVQKKKKLDKMQEFSGQVKSVNAERIRPPRPDQKKQQPKEPNARQKALEYSRNVPKPVVKKIEREEDEEKQERNYSERLPEEEQLTELQLYEMKHEQLKKMIHNQY